MALMHVKVYYKFCPTETQNLAIFPRTISGPSEVSLAKAQGACVPNATQVIVNLFIFLIGGFKSSTVLTCESVSKA
jgi:hypothetical protein